MSWTAPSSWMHGLLWVLHDIGHLQRATKLLPYFASWYPCLGRMNPAGLGLVTFSQMPLSLLKVSDCVCSLFEFRTLLPILLLPSFHRQSRRHLLSLLSLSSTLRVSPNSRLLLRLIYNVSNRHTTPPFLLDGVARQIKILIT